MHTELRVRTLCELVLNKDFYLQPSVVSLLDPYGHVISKNAMIGTSANYDIALNKVHVHVDKDAARIILDLDCLETSKSCSYSNMWHVHAIASILERPLTSIYPDKNLRIRPMFHKVITPRIHTHHLQEVSIPILIMWTTTNTFMHSTQWSPNHFVPCIDVNLRQNKLSTASASVSGITSHLPSTPSIIHLTSTDLPMDCSLSDSTLTSLPASSPTSCDIQDQLKSSSAPPANPSATVTSQSSIIPLTLTDSQVESNLLPTLCTSDSLSDSSLPSSSPTSRDIQDQLKSSSAPPANPSATVTSQSSIIPLTLTDSQVESNLLPTLCTSDSTLTMTSNLPGSSLFKLKHTDNQFKASSESVSKGILVSALYKAKLSKKVKPKQHKQASSKSIKCFMRAVDSNNQTRSTSSTISPEDEKTSSSPQEERPVFPSHSSSVSTSKAPQEARTSKSNSVTTSSVVNAKLVVQPPSKVKLTTLALVNALSKMQKHTCTYKPPKAGTTSKKISTYFPPLVVRSASDVSGDCPHSESSQLSTSSSSDDEYSDYHLYLSESDNDSNPDVSDNYCEDAMETEVTPEVVVQSQTQGHPLPFPSLPCQWYQHQHDLSIKNAARMRSRHSNLTTKDIKGNILSVNRCTVKETLVQSIERLQDRIKDNTDSKAKKNFSALLKVGRFVLARGPVVRTRDAGDIYVREKGLTDNIYSAIELYEIFCKYLSVSQVYMFRQAYLVQNAPESDLDAVMTSLNQMIDKDEIVKEITEQRLKELLLPAVKYMDTPRDKLVMKGLIGELTNNNTFTSSLLGLKSRRGVTSAREKLHSHLSQYQQICKTSQTVRNDLTTQQQYKLTQRIISRRKLNEIKVISEGRGRKLKITEFPELSAVLTFAFGEYDMREGGGGLEAHPRLTIGTMYKSSDSVLTMKRAREILLSCAPQGFRISLSACYNYTENYRAGSKQASQHHAGKDVNASLSLRKPPRTGVEHLVVNLHWTTANVNLLIDGAHGLPNAIVVSKDAKAVVPSEISPVQIQGHSWKKRTVLPDHSWDQSRTNSVTPMTFLFLETVIRQLPATTIETLELPVSETTTLHLKRTGQGVTLINLSFFEPETTFRCLNEILYLLTLAVLDPFFRNLTTGQLKDEFTFIVDNGPAEQPSSPLVQMSLIRLLKVLNLKKIVQVSFAEYHSKRNFVERVHAEENRVLSKHGPFSSKSVHPQAVAGSKEHVDNMEHMANEVCSCISQGSFGSKSLLAFRGVKPSDFVFVDEKPLQKFLDMSEEGKQQFDPFSYSVEQGTLLDKLHFIWGVDRNFTGSYLQDYRAINNELITGIRTAWVDKYTSCFYSTTDSTNIKRFELQPIPDYLRWLKTGELHYLPLEERSLLLGEWDDIPGAYLPSKIMELCYALVPNPDDDMIAQISLLAWITPQEVKGFFKKVHDQFDSQMKIEVSRRMWKSHLLFQNNTKVQLEGLCRNMKIPFTASTLKHQLVQLISEAKGEDPPTTPGPLYNGNISSIPRTLASVNHLTMPELRAILIHHGYSPVGKKDQLVIKVFLLRTNQLTAITAREEKQINDLIEMTNKVIYKQRELNISSHIYRKRIFTLQTKSPHFIKPPAHVQGEKDLQHLFDPLIKRIGEIYAHKTNENEPLLTPCKPTSNVNSTNDGDALLEKITQVGAKVKVQWSTDEVKNSGWRAGWYVAVVQQYHPESDMLLITYASEPDNVYEEELTPLISKKRIKLVWSPM